MQFSKKECEYLRQKLKNEFQPLIQTWIEAGAMFCPERNRYLEKSTSQQGQRNNNRIIDPSHFVSKRSYVSGFLEGNTSTTRPWIRYEHPDPWINSQTINREWLQRISSRVLTALSSSNFYYQLGSHGYSDYGVYGTSGMMVEELPARLHFHDLVPGSYYVMNDSYGLPETIVREFSLNVKSVVDTYGRKVNGKVEWSNISKRVRKLYEQGDYNEKVDLVQYVSRNKHYKATMPQIYLNREWISLTYEMGSGNGLNYSEGQDTGDFELFGLSDNTFLRVKASSRKPFIIFRQPSSNNFAYGEETPAIQVLGLIYSLQKKAIGKDIALEKMINPAVQGPANLRPSYRTTAPNSYVPIDQFSTKEKLTTVFDVNPAIVNLNVDINEWRQIVRKIWFEDFLLYLTNNPKTRTKYETEVVESEKQLVVGPNLQSLNTTLNTQVSDFVFDWVLETDPYIGPPPPDLQGEYIIANYVSVFAQAQRAADLPSIRQYAAEMFNAAQMAPQSGIFDKFDVDKYADVLADRYYVPAGLNRDDAAVDAIREKREADAQRQQMIQETIPNLAQAAGNIGMKVQQ